MKTLSALLGALAILWSGCAVTMARRDIHLEIVNLSSRDLNKAEARFGKDTCPWGFVGRTFSADYMFYRGEVTAEAELRWWEEGSGQRAEKIDLREALQSKESGTLIFSVTDSGVKVHFRKDKEPNQAPEPTPTSVTPRADARAAPAAGVAHL